MIIPIPYPPTGNHATKHSAGRHYLTPEAKQYRNHVAMLAKAQGACRGIAAGLRVVCKVYPPDRRRRDLDNVWKTVGDALTHAGVWVDDSQIDDLRLVRMETRKGGHVVVEVNQIG